MIKKIDPTLKRVSCFLPVFVFSYFLVTAQPVLTFTPIVQNMSKPIDIKHAKDGSGRMFIVEQTGKIRIYKDGQLLQKPFLDITGIVKQGTYKGIINMTFAPNYKKNRTFFVYYLDTLNRTTVARYTASKENPDSAIVSSGRILMQFSPVDTGDTKISLGCIGFGRDHLLYISLSDGSYIGTVTNLAQNGNVPYGKILRVDVNVTDSPYYRIPPTNPFVNDPNVRDDVWAIGIRNMWRWSFDRLNGNMWLADDGNENRDEIDMITPAEVGGGMNFGWKCYEGDQPYDTTGCSDAGSYRYPLYSIIHDSLTGGYAVIGGYVYRGTAFPALYGYYICSDYITANAWLIKPDVVEKWKIYRQAAIPSEIESYGEIENGELYATSLDGTVYQVGGIPATSGISGKPNSMVAINSPNISMSRIYPTLVNNGNIILELNESYDSFRLFDLNGHLILQKNLHTTKGKLQVSLPTLVPGMYTGELVGRHVLKQKIFVSK